jgi:hypothetical protein
MFKNGNILIRIIVIMFALLQPFIIMYYYGLSLPSISSAWLTNLQPLFIITNACTSYFLLGVNGWKIPGFLLLLLTSFSLEYSMVIHNIIASLFFLSCIKGICMIHRLKWYLFLYFSSLLIWLFFGMFIGEVFGIFVICCYHINLLWITSKIMNR